MTRVSKTTKFENGGFPFSALLGRRKNRCVLAPSPERIISVLSANNGRWKRRIARFCRFRLWMQKASLDSNCILLHFHARFLHAKKLLAHAFAKTWRLSDGVTLQNRRRLQNNSHMAAMHFLPHTQASNLIQTLHHKTHHRSRTCLQKNKNKGSAIVLFWNHITLSAHTNLWVLC